MLRGPRKITDSWSISRCESLSVVWRCPDLAQNIFPVNVEIDKTAAFLEQRYISYL